MNEKYNVLINGNLIVLDEAAYMKFLSHLVPSLTKTRLDTDSFWLTISLDLPLDIIYEFRIYDEILVINKEFVDLFYKIILPNG